MPFWKASKWSQKALKARLKATHSRQQQERVRATTQMRADA
jgi:hypothetical protein